MKGKRGCVCGMTVRDDGSVSLPDEPCAKRNHENLPECACPEDGKDPLVLVDECMNEDGTLKDQDKPIWMYTLDKFGRQHQEGCESIDRTMQPLLNDDGKQIGWHSVASGESRLEWLHSIVDYLVSLGTVDFEKACGKTIAAIAVEMTSKARMAGVGNES